MFIWFLLGCDVNETGPATPGSPAAAEVDVIATLSDQAREIAVLSASLEQLADASRDLPAEQRKEHIQKMRDLMDAINERNDAFQQATRDLEARLHESAGDPNPDPDDDPTSP